MAKFTFFNKARTLYLIYTFIAERERLTSISMEIRIFANNELLLAIKVVLNAFILIFLITFVTMKNIDI